MDKLTKIFQSGEVLQAQDLNTIKEKVNELVDKVGTLQEKIDSISLNYIIAEDMDITLSLSSISINNGTASVTERPVSIRFVCTSTPTHYMLSESPSFSGASWTAFANPAPFTLSSVEGSKTVYAKIKDASGESSVKNDSVEYNVNPPVTELSLSSISINNGAASTSAFPVSVGFTYTGTPTHYMLSESPSFSGGTWRAFSSPASFTLSSGNGTKTIYAKIKDASGESLVKSDSITYSPPISGNIAFTDAEFKRVMVSRYDTSGDGEISIPEAEAVTAWGSEMFNNTTVVNMDELKYFKNASPSIQSALSGCTALESIEYPDNWEMKGSELKGDTALSHVKLPNNLTTIKTSTFENCTALESIEFPANVTTLETNAFLNSGLVRVVIPDTITDIGNLGNNCAKLIFVDLGHRVTSMGNNAFVGASIETFIIRATAVPAMGYGSLKDITAQIYVPDESITAYKNAVWFKPHAARIYPLSEYQG